MSCRVGAMATRAGSYDIRRGRLDMKQQTKASSVVVRAAAAGDWLPPPVNNAFRPSAAESCRPTSLETSPVTLPLPGPYIHISGAYSRTMLLSRSAALFGALASVVCASPVQDVLQDDAAYKHLDLTHDLFGFHKNLTQIESITGNEKAVGEWLVESLSSQGYNVEKQVVGKDPLRFNVLAWPGSKRDAKVMVSSHIDTVSMA